jgi:hypothetical protein
MSEKKASEKRPASKVCEFPQDSKSEELKIMVNAPRYVCMACGKSAAKDENLCRPERMFSSW